MIIMLHTEFWMLLTCNCIPDYRYATSIPVFNGYALQYCVSLFETIVKNCFIDETKITQFVALSEGPFDGTKSIS